MRSKGVFMNSVITAKSGRKFAGHAAALIAFIINQDERFLMLAHPKRPDKWEPVNGAYDAGETILEGMMREIGEEAGQFIQVRPLTAVHTYNFRYDDEVSKVISVIFLFEYLSGEVFPDDDMAGSEIKWMSLDDIHSGNYEIIVPSQQLWVYDRAVQFYRLLKDAPEVNLQPNYEGLKNKYGE
jgi:8-oxo-dGTP pyrophosphatase MutT (NUDIX family)